MLRYKVMSVNNSLYITCGFAALNLQLTDIAAIPPDSTVRCIIAGRSIVGRSDLIYSTVGCSTVGCSIVRRNENVSYIVKAV